MTGENVCSNCGNDFGMYEVEECCCGQGCMDCCACWEGCDECPNPCDDFELDENDGQPDEMQEWHDFDPDC